MTSSFIIQLLISGLTMGSIYALVAIAYNIIFSTTHIINFATGEFVMLGALVTLSLVTGVHIPSLAAIPIAMVVVAVVGLLVERLAYRPVQGVKVAGHSIAWIISTLAFSIILQNIAMIIWGKEFLPVPPPFGSRNISFMGAALDTNQIYIFLAALTIALLVEVLLNKTYIGMMIKATSVNRRAAEYMGIKTAFVISLSFAIAGGISAIAGILVSPLTFASSTMGLLIGLKGFAVAIMGGLGSGHGAILAGLLLGICEVFAGSLFSPGYRDIVAFILLIAVLALKPDGLFGEAIQEKA
ncbi:branched-chain amino acid ABC transporter permease [Aneurinibacillus terranovensis]|uniref:branched-chain amino acid ABC transporter permease n=1 Tax=Aneurinibacillus terranovensis TaxID=278991 RepID=UPI00041E4D37|nr:branched-chain amino acid ABC transporter permease [Aneurinibacillus terranovensis]